MNNTTEEPVEGKDSLKGTFLTAKQALTFAYQKEKKLVIYTLIFAIILAAIVFIQAASFSVIVNEIIRIQVNKLGITRTLIKDSIILGISFLIPAVIQNLQSKFLNELNVRIGTHIELLQVDSYSKLDIGTVEGTEFQTKLQRASKWGPGTIWNTIYYTRMMVADIAGFVTSGIVLFLINPYLIALAIIGALPYYFVENIYGLKLFRLYYSHTDESRVAADRLSFFKDPRMAVARIFYRDAAISVLDEPTSAIDAVAEEKIFEVLETKMTDKTVVLISHRFSTVKNADAIAVIEHGELKELGSHKELIKKHGRYYELFSMQANRYLESE
jgi:ABC-type bacteriocin/lantibiotic exporter with double-glycine peptidase domain